MIALTDTLFSNLSTCGWLHPTLFRVSYTTAFRAVRHCALLPVVRHCTAFTYSLHWAQKSPLFTAGFSSTVHCLLPGLLPVPYSAAVPTVRHCPLGTVRCELSLFGTTVHCWLLVCCSLLTPCLACYLCPSPGGADPQVLKPLFSALCTVLIALHSLAHCTGPRSLFTAYLLSGL